MMQEIEPAEMAAILSRRAGEARVRLANCRDPMGSEATWLAGLIGALECGASMLERIEPPKPPPFRIYGDGKDMPWIKGGPTR